MKKDLVSLSILVGTGQCDANCAFCAGKPLRKYAPKKDGEVNEALVKDALEKCFQRGARYLSLSSCGEPTLSPRAVTRVLELVSGSREAGIFYSPINLYSNGIRIGEDRAFCDKYLPLWRDLGLTTMYITVHDINPEGNARVYHVKSYPSIESIFSRIHNFDLSIRTNLVLSRGAIDSFDKFLGAFDYLKKIGSDAISTWPLRDKNDMLDVELSPPQEELLKIGRFVEENKNKSLRMVFEQYPTHYTLGNKLTLFPDGSLSSSWCNR